jgi:hypothetical protein
MEVLRDPYAVVVGQNRHEYPSRMTSQLFIGGASSGVAGFRKEPPGLAPQNT